MSLQEAQKTVKVALISLGCAKNLVDAEIMLGALLQSGAEITSEPALADALIVNTCSFIEAAQQEAVDTILESEEVREAHRPGQALIVAGCLPQRFRDELPRLLPEVDAFIGIDQVSEIAGLVQQALAHRQERLASSEARSKDRNRKTRIAERFVELERDGLAGKERGAPKKQELTDAKRNEKSGSVEPLVDVHVRPNFMPDFGTPRYRLTPRHLAYVKIAEGCNHPCSFCIIPRIRGSHRSRAQADILQEARQLLADGAKEINLISQDTTYYGLDLRLRRSGAISSPERFQVAARDLQGQSPTLCSLLRELNELPGEFWIRLLYTHPAHWTEELIDTIGQCPKVARYVDIPLQHIHGLMLERMRRETSREYIVDLLERIRKRIPAITLRTTFIVGFPGETEACFQELLEFIRTTRFERLGVFAYSQEEGTKAAHMESQVPEKIKIKRRDLAMSTQHEVAVQVSESQLGRTLKVLVEQQAQRAELERARVFSWEHGLIRGTEVQPMQLRGRKYVVARGEADAPDIDGRVYVRGNLPLGEFASVRIVGHTDYDLIAEPA